MAKKSQIDKQAFLKFLEGQITFMSTDGPLQNKVTAVMLGSIKNIIERGGFDVQVPPWKKSKVS